MKSLSLFIALLFTVNLMSQSFNCDQYRKIMDTEMDALGYNDSTRKYIVGKDGEYYKIGMSNLFISEPKVPQYIYENENVEPHIAKIIIAHVDLYHCDLIEKEFVKKRPNSIASHKIDVIISPNPTNGILKIESRNKIEKLYIFNSEGKIIQEINVFAESINLSNEKKGIYFLHIITEAGNEVKKVILE